MGKMRINRDKVDICRARKKKSVADLAKSLWRKSGENECHSQPKGSICCFRWKAGGCSWVRCN